MSSLGAVGRIAGKASAYIKQTHESTVTGFILNIIPETLASPLVSGDVLQVLFIAILFGVSISLARVTGAGFITLAATLTNFSGNAVASIVVSRWDGQLDEQRLHALLDNPALLDEPEAGPDPALPADARIPEGG
ncbi:MAG: cation:dicarboxylase symporter family transporter [Betaproteobacteria bacterium]|nr:cation:dicarboxylase symporter family transporter [Betaproteobacteria bacterium]